MDSSESYRLPLPPLTEPNGRRGNKDEDIKKNSIFRAVLIFFLLIAATLAGCKKSSDSVPQNVFIKLFPADSSYKTGGCFQLADGNYVIYGFDPDNGGLLPLVIKTDQEGKVIWQRKLPSVFHYLTIKPTLDGNMLAVGVPENKITENEYVCKIYSKDSIGAIWPFPIDSVKTTKDYLPDFVEDPVTGNFIITGSRKENVGDNKGKFEPFILRINQNGQMLALNHYYLVSGTNMTTISICNNGNGFSLCGGTKKTSQNFPGMFYLRVDPQLAVVSDTVVWDTTQAINPAALIDDGESSFICGSAGGIGLSGTLFRWKVDEDGIFDPMHIFYKDYENLGRFREINRTTDGYIAIATVDKLGVDNLVSYTKIYLLKLDAEGNEQWSRQFNSTNSYTGVSAVQTFDGGYLVSAYEHTTSYVFTMVLIKTDANGNIVEQ